MSKRNGVNEKRIEKWLEDWGGNAEGRHYRPFLHIRDVPSTGNSYMPWGITTGREHHFLSELEYQHFLLFEFDETIIDIREQFALVPRGETQAIAETLGIKHPRFPGSGLYTVMTTDFLLTRQTGQMTQYEAISVKHSSALDPSSKGFARVMEKQCLEMEYWNEKCIPWHISTNDELPINKVRNLDNMRMSLFDRNLDRHNACLEKFVDLVCEFWHPEITQIDLLAFVGCKFGISQVESVKLFHKSVWLHLIEVDLDRNIIHPEFPIHLKQDDRHA